MLLPRFVVEMVSVGMMVLGAGVVSGQSYPNKPIRIVTPASGGGVDFAARLIAQGLSGSLGQQVIVDNRVSTIAAEVVSRASADGYTLLFIGTNFWIAPLLRKHVPYDPVKEFSPITLAMSSPNLIVVHPSVAANSVKELIALAKTKPGELNYSTGSIGSTQHFAAELFKAMAGVNIVNIPYKGAGPALNALLGGQVQMMFPNVGTVASHLKSGRLRALAVASARSSALAPGLPTVAASGLPGYEAVALIGMFAPAKTPATIIKRLNQETVRFLDTAEAKERFLNAGVEVVGSSPEQFAATIKSDMVKWGKLIQDLGIREE